MPTLKLATWNINSVRIRLEHVARFVAEAKPDVLCLQEIKCRDGEFPTKAFAEAGLKHLAIAGQKGWHGVAVASRFPIEALPALDLCRHGEARVQAVRVEGMEIHNLYVPAGGDVADPAVNPKFDHKLDFITRMRAAYAGLSGPRVLVGDLNIAPGEHDVWSHKQLLDVVSHTPVETDGLEAVRTAGGFVDVARAQRPAEEKIFTWWSYRSADWRANNRGRRLDHIWASPDLSAQMDRYTVHVDARDWQKPSDHVPVSVRLKL
jgi:exodeoxyribonuclease III